MSPDEVPAATPVTGGLDRSHIGAPLSAAAFRTLDGKPATLAGIARGKPLLVNLWATWCGPCVRELPTLDRLAARGMVRVAAVSQDTDDGGTHGGVVTSPSDPSFPNPTSDGAANVRAFVAKARLKALPVYLDGQSALSLAYQANLPTSILYDSAGKEVWRYTGDLDWTGAQATKLLAEAR